MIVAECRSPVECDLEPMALTEPAKRPAEGARIHGLAGLVRHHVVVLVLGHPKGQHFLSLTELPPAQGGDQRPGQGNGPGLPALGGAPPGPADDQHAIVHLDVPPPQPAHLADPQTSG